MVRIGIAFDTHGISRWSIPGTEKTGIILMAFINNWLITMEDVRNDKINNADSTHIGLNRLKDGDYTFTNVSVCNRVIMYRYFIKTKAICCLPHFGLICGLYQNQYLMVNKQITNMYSNNAE
jgi:hypothetical protein